MADINIADLTNNTLAATDYLHISKNSADYKIPASNVLIALPFVDTVANNLNALGTAKSELLPDPLSTSITNQQAYIIPGGWSTNEYGFTIGLSGYESSNNIISKNTWFFGQNTHGMVNTYHVSTDGGNTYTNNHYHYCPQEATTSYNIQNGSNMLTSPDDSALNGGGRLNLTITAAGLVIIRFWLYCTAAGTVTDKYSPGFSKSLIENVLSDWTVTGTGIGTCTYLKSDNTLDTSANGYGGACYINSAQTQFILGRCYDAQGNIGAWSPSKFTVGMKVYGTTYAKAIRKT